MFDGVWSSTLREMRAEFSRPVLWVILIGIGIVLALAGAFGTADILTPVPLAVYWVAVVILTYGAGSLVSGLLGGALKGRSLPVRVCVKGLCSTLAIAGVILGLNFALFGLFLETGAEWIAFLGTILGVVLIVTAVLEMALSSEPHHGDQSPAPPALLKRLPLEKRGGLVSLSVEDHYVRVRTSKGEELLLMRLSDAMDEAGDGGFQVHRSHWIDPATVTSARREGDRAILSMAHGPDIPVSRRYVPLIREAGLLPR